MVKWRQNMPVRENPFKSIYQKLNSGVLESTSHDMPLLVDIEVTNACNFNCLFCFTGTQAHKRPTGFMSVEMYDGIIEQIAPYQIPLRFSRWGEPTLHKNFFDFIRKAKENNLICHVNTNGSLLNKNNINRLLEVKLDSVKFSFQGTDEKTYSEMRYGQSYNKLVDTVKLFHKLRENRPYPYLQINTTVTYETPEMIQSFKDELSPFADLIEVGKTNLTHISAEQTKLPEEAKKLLDDLKTQQTIKKDYRRCNEVYDKLSINWDGSVTVCCGDYDNYMIVGNLNETSLQDIWHNSRQLKYYRSMLSEFKHEELPLCKTCYDTMALRKSK